MRILLIGSDGQVGWELQRALAPLGELFVASRTPGAALRADLEQPELLREVIRRAHPDVVVNAAA